MAELTIEQVQALYFDADALREPPYRMYRADGGERRWYFSPELDAYKVSVTSLIDATNPTPYGLQQWMKTHGHDSDGMAEERAAYGTMAHDKWTDLLLSRSYDLDTIPDLVASMDRRGGSVHKWANDLAHDLLAFECFIRHYNVKPLAVEVVLASEDGYAGALDLVAEIDGGARYVSGAKRHQLKDPKASTREVVIIDYKSGRKGFYESHEMQLHLYKRLWNENGLGPQASRVLNFAPKDWHKAPDFSLKDQTGSKHAAKLDFMIGQFWAVNSEPSPPTRLSGLITPDTDLESLISRVSIRDHVAGLGMTRAA